jgi:sulfur relay (sulfurtransferase) DsrF/TusC family protein
MQEITFIVEESPEGGYIARAAETSIYTQANNQESLHALIRDAVCCHFHETAPRIATAGDATIYC